MGSHLFLPSRNFSNNLSPVDSTFSTKLNLLKHVKFSNISHLKIYKQIKHTHTHKNSINPTSLQPTNLPLLFAVKQNCLSSPYCFFTSISSSVYTNPTSVLSLLAKPTKTSRLLKARYISGCSLLILSKQAFTRLLSRADRAMACTKVPYRGIKWAEWKLLFKILNNNPGSDPDNSK